MEPLSLLPTIAFTGAVVVLILAVAAFVLSTLWERTSDSLLDECSAPVGPHLLTESTSLPTLLPSAPTRPFELTDLHPRLDRSAVPGTYGSGLSAYVEAPAAMGTC